MLLFSVPFTVQKFKALALLFLFGLVIFPWPLICIAHPAGHAHQQHPPGTLSACEQHRQVAGKKGVFLLPPMHCHSISSETGNFELSNSSQIKPDVQSLAIVAVLFELLNINSPEKAYITHPQTRCRSATASVVNTLRGPPSC